MVRSKKTGLDYPEPTIPPPAELQQRFSELRRGDMVFLYVQYENDMYSIYPLFVVKRDERMCFVTHVEQGFALNDGKAHDKKGNLIAHWQLLPSTEEIQLAVQHERLVERVSHLLNDRMHLLAAMSDDQLIAVEALFEQVEGQRPVYPLVNVKEERVLEAERQKALQGGDA